MGVSVKSVKVFSRMIFSCAGDNLVQKNVFVFRILGLCRSVLCRVERAGIQWYVFLTGIVCKKFLRTLEGELNWIP